MGAQNRPWSESSFEDYTAIASRNFACPPMWQEDSVFLHIHHHAVGKDADEVRVELRPGQGQLSAATTDISRAFKAVQTTMRNLQIENYYRGGPVGGIAVLPSGAVHDLESLGVPRAPNEEFRIVTSDGLRLRDMPPCPELTRILHVVCEVFDVPYAVLSFYTNGW